MEESGFERWASSRAGNTTGPESSFPVRSRQFGLFLRTCPRRLSCWASKTHWTIAGQADTLHGIMKQPAHPFQVDVNELNQHIETFVDAVIKELSSFYLELPRGGHFVEYEDFKSAYRVLAAATDNFSHLDRETIRHIVRQNGLALVVLRCVVGLSPPELADLASDTQGIPVSQNFARLQDQKARDGDALFTDRVQPQTAQRLDALIDAACLAIETGPGPTAASDVVIHRLTKVDTAEGLRSLQVVAKEGIEFPMLLYERLLGRPFASHRDSVSEEVGDIVEDAIVKELSDARIPFYKTKRAERIEGFDQAPDFLIPNQVERRIVIEAKLTQDDGTARDKVTRVQHLDRLSDSGKRFEVIACIDGRGFKIRREDMKKLLLATSGKVFSVATMCHLVSHTGLRDFAER